MLSAANRWIRYIHFMFGFSLPVLSSVVFAQPSVPLLTVSKAVSTALEKNPLFLGSKEAINQANAQVPFVRSALMPNLTYFTSAGSKQDATANTPKFDGHAYNIYESDLRLTQPIFAYGSLSAISAAKKDVQLSQVNSQLSRRNLISIVVLSYYGVVLASRNFDTLLRQQKIVNESLAIAQRRYKIGRGQLLDVLQVKTQLALLASQVASARNQIEIATASLASYLSEPQASKFRIKNTMNVPEIKKIDQTVHPAKGEILELERNRLALEKIEDQKSVLLGQSLPSLSLTADYFYNSNKAPDLYSGSSSSWQAQAVLTIPLFSGLSSVYQRRAIVSQRAQLELEKNHLQNQTDLLQITSRKSLETAMQTIISGDEALILAQASFDQAKKNYQFATIDFLQYLSVQKDFVLAEQSSSAYKYNYIAALADYYTAHGQDMNSLVEVMEEANR